MKILTIIPILFLTITALGQTDINRKNDNGQKIGKWVTYHDNGKIDEVCYYKPESRKLTNSESFFHAATSDKDSTVYSEKLMWSEKYEYRENWDLKRVLRKENSKKPIYLYGPSKEIALRNSDFYYTNHVDSTRIISVELTNITDKSIVLTPKVNSNSITTDSQELVLPANQILSFSFKLTFEPNEKEYLISLINDSIIIDFSIQTFGYHIESKQIEKGHQLRVKKSFVYYRTGNEALLKLYDINKEKEIKVISLAKQKTQVDLKKVRPGNYWLCIVDYKDDKRTFCKIKIEK